MKQVKLLAAILASAAFLTSCNDEFEGKLTAQQPITVIAKDKKSYQLPAGTSHLKLKIKEKDSKITQLTFITQINGKKREIQLKTNFDRSDTYSRGAKVYGSSTGQPFDLEIFYDIESYNSPDRREVVACTVTRTSRVCRKDVTTKTEVCEDITVTRPGYKQVTVSSSSYDKTYDINVLVNNAVVGKIKVDRYDSYNHSSDNSGCY